MIFPQRPSLGSRVSDGILAQPQLLRREGLVGMRTCGIRVERRCGRTAIFEACCCPEKASALVRLRFRSRLRADISRTAPPCVVFMKSTDVMPLHEVCRHPCETPCYATRASVGKCTSLSDQTSNSSKLGTRHRTLGYLDPWINVACDNLVLSSLANLGLRINSQRPDKRD